MASIKKSMEDLLAELIAEVKNLHATSTELAGHLRSGIVNDLLLVETTTFPTSGIISRDFPSPYGSVQVTNQSSTNTVTVSSNPPESSAPSGRGVYKVLSQSSATINLWGRALTLYGTSGDTVSYQVMTKSSRPFVVS